MQSANQCPAIGFRSEPKFVRLQPCGDEAVDRVGQALGQAGLCFGVHLSRLQRSAVAAVMRKIFYALAALGLGMVTSANGAGLLANGGFESGDGEGTDNWNSSQGSPPARSEAEAHSGKYSMRAALKNDDATPSEGHLSQSVVSGVVGGKTYDLSFWAKQTDHGASYVQEYAIEWYDDNGARLPGKGLTRFRGGKDKWAKFSAAGIPVPVGATGVRLLFRFVTGAVKGGSGEVFIDDVALVPSDGSTPVAVKPSEVKLPGGVKKPAPKKITQAKPAKPVKPAAALGQAGANPDATDPTWAAVKAVLQKGVAKADRDALQKCMRDLGVLRRKWRQSPAISEASELVGLYLFSKARPEQFAPSANRWLTRYPESEWARDVMVDTVYLQIDQAQYREAGTVISNFLKRFPDDSEAAKFKILQNHVKRFAEATEKNRQK